MHHTHKQLWPTPEIEFKQLPQELKGRRDRRLMRLILNVLFLRNLRRPVWLTVSDEWDFVLCLSHVQISCWSVCLLCVVVFLTAPCFSSSQEMIEEADRDGDGEVNEQEFLRVMKKTNLYWAPCSSVLFLKLSYFSEQFKR